MEKSRFSSSRVVTDNHIGEGPQAERARRGQTVCRCGRGQLVLAQEEAYPVTRGAQGGGLGMWVSRAWGQRECGLARKRQKFMENGGSQGLGRKTKER